MMTSCRADQAAIQSSPALELVLSRRAATVVDDGSRRIAAVVVVVVAASPPVAVGPSPLAVGLHRDHQRGPATSATSTFLLPS